MHFLCSLKKEIITSNKKETRETCLLSRGKGIGAEFEWYLISYVYIFYYEYYLWLLFLIKENGYIDTLV
jgi:hypothetical protein